MPISQMSPADPEAGADRGNLHGPDTIPLFGRRNRQRPAGAWSPASPSSSIFNKLPKSGHLAAWEQPAAFVDELRATFREMR